jgi:hypothetical protein
LRDFRGNRHGYRLICFGDRGQAGHDLPDPAARPRSKAVKLSPVATLDEIAQFARQRVVALGQLTIAQHEGPKACTILGCHKVIDAVKLVDSELGARHARGAQDGRQHKGRQREFRSCRGYGKRPVPECADK